MPTLQGGLARGTLHEVFAEAGRQSAAATGFVAGLAHRVAAQRPLVWVQQEFGALETGALSMGGWGELGFDPRLLVMVRARDVEMALRIAADALSLRCARRRRARSLGRGAAARSGRQPQAGAGGARLRRHRADAALVGGADAVDGRDPLDCPRGAFAARERRCAVAADGARPFSTHNSCATVVARTGNGSWNGNVMSAFSVTQRRILSLWLPRLPIDRIKRRKQSASRSASRGGGQQRRTG